MTLTTDNGGATLPAAPNVATTMATQSTPVPISDDAMPLVSSTLVIAGAGTSTQSVVAPEIPTVSGAGGAVLAVLLAIAALFVARRRV